MKHKHTSPKLLAAYITVRHGQANEPRASMWQPMRVDLSMLIDGCDLVTISTYIRHR